mgnify:CR=1 FL=1
MEKVENIGLEPMTPCVDRRQRQMCIRDSFNIFKTFPFPVFPFPYKWWSLFNINIIRSIINTYYIAEKPNKSSNENLNDK